MSTLTRRGLIAGSASFAAAAAAPQSSSNGRPKNIVIASANGVHCCQKAMGVILKGGDTLDAVIAGVNLLEEDPNDDSIGYGGLPNEEGIVELDASVMHGPTRRCGAVASIRNCMYPSRVAKLVMEQTDHVMLAGEGATRFAKDWGFPEVNLLTERSRIAWMVWKQSLRDPRGHSYWTDGTDAPPHANKIAELRKAFPGADEDLLAYAWERAIHPITGTINCLGLNEKGEMSGVTTTSGMAWKIPGRVGDSPIIGAGLYVDQEVGGAGSTGRGEENIRVAGAHTIVENMRHGMSPTEACVDAMKRVSRNYDHDRKRMESFNINFYALRKDGVYGGSVLFAPRGKPSKFSVNDTGGESRLENCETLYET
ncbi:MAG TPA: N(4)-(beta-N-acetylglucosaminyl)-L-asparaginase [Bryobacteraceae bacterium]|jgi:N4-(beta-N-acetylglucosaminyl)-L-asparaginase